jgi:hypothetical protein
VICRHRTKLLAKVIGTKGLTRLAVVAMAVGLYPAMASPNLQCTPAADIDGAAATTLCDAFAATVAQSAWAKRQGDVTMQLDVNSLRPTAINITLNLTNAAGSAHTINRAFSASDTTITPAMQDAFLQKLLSAIPPDF